MTQVTDERGAMASRFNIVDLAALVLVLVVIPLGYVAWRLFHQPPPVIESVTPSSVSVDSSRRVRLKGQHFVPYLNAFLAKTNEPFSVPDRNPENVQATFLIETPTDVELQLPDVDPGTYDLYLFDEGREVAHKAAAVTLTKGNRRRRVRVGDPLPDDAIVEFAVRFLVDNSVAPLVTADTVDLNQPDRGTPQETPATLVSVRPAGTKPATVDVPAKTAIEAVVRAGATRDHGVFMYPEAQRLRAGEEFWFGTRDYVISGTITKVLSVRELP